MRGCHGPRETSTTDRVGTCHQGWDESGIAILMGSFPVPHRLLKLTCLGPWVVMRNNEVKVLSLTGWEVGSRTELPPAPFASPHHWGGDPAAMTPSIAPLQHLFSHPKTILSPLQQAWA